jgi:hypothetical protein
MLALGGILFGHTGVRFLGVLWLAIQTEQPLCYTCDFVGN